MPQQEITYQYQFCVYWPFAGYGPDGQAIIQNTPSQVNCRWEDKWRQALDSKGNTIKLDGDVWIAHPTGFTPLAIGSILYQGLLTDWYGSGSVINPPITPVGLYEIIDYKRFPDIKGRAVLWRYGVIRYKDKLPAFLGG